MILQARFRQSIRKNSTVTSKKRSIKEGENIELPRVSESNGDLENLPVASTPLVGPKSAIPSSTAVPIAVPKKVSTKKQGSNSESRKKKVTTMVAVVTLNFGICWLPTHLFIILKRLIRVSPDSNAYVYLTIFKLIAHTLSYLTPVINPVLYAFYNENFLLPLIDIWSRITCRSAKADLPNSQRKHGGKNGLPQISNQSNYITREQKDICISLYTSIKTEKIQQKSSKYINILPVNS